MMNGRVLRKGLCRNLLRTGDYSPLTYPLKETEARDLLEIVESRYKRNSTIFCSQFDIPGWPDLTQLSIFNLSGGTAQSVRSHCSISAEPLLNPAGRGDFGERRTHFVWEFVQKCDRQ